MRVSTVITHGGPVRNYRHLVHCGACDCVFATDVLTSFDDSVPCPTCNTPRGLHSTFAFATLRHGMTPEIRWECDASRRFALVPPESTEAKWAHLAPQIVEALSKIEVQVTR